MSSDLFAKARVNVTLSMALTALILSACGGGGSAAGGPSPGSGSSGNPVSGGAPADGQSTPGTGGNATPPPADSGGTSSPAPADSDGTGTPPAPDPGGTGGSAPTDPIGGGSPAPTDPIGTGGSTPSGATAAPSVRALSADASLLLSGIPETPLAAPPLPAPDAGSRAFYVDSRNGDDRLDGRSATPGAAGASGPWKSLARVLQSDMGPGDTLVLACGSTWNETLRLPRNGSSAKPVLVTAPPAGCGTTPRPTIDGSVPVPGAGWVQQSGSVYRTALSAAPLQLFASGRSLTEAHHPNRGHSAADPTSPYLTLPAAGNVVTGSNGKPVSTALTLGPELALPAGAVLDAGTRLRVRTVAWSIDDVEVAAVTQGTVTLANPTSYPAQAGWGYFLMGRAWMVDSPREWHHDPGTGRLTAWLPGGPAGAGEVRATVLGTAVDLRDRSHVVLDGIAIQRVGTGVDATRSQGVVLRNSTVEDVANLGIDATRSTAMQVLSNVIARTGTGAVFATGGQTPTLGLTLRDNLVRDAGVLIDDTGIVSLPRRSRAAMLTGEHAVVQGNAVVNAGYAGILSGRGGQVEGNLVINACAVLDDCGGIYASGVDNRSVIRANVVMSAHSSGQGKPGGVGGYHAQGIYLDESASGVQVEDNTAIDNDNGIKLHVAADNVVRGNTLMGNWQSQMVLYESRARDNPNGDLYGNLITDNVIAPLSPASVGLKLQTVMGSTAAFGTIDRNRYLDRMAPVVVQNTTKQASEEYRLSEWQRATAARLPAGRDQLGWGTALSGHAGYAASAGNLILHDQMLPGANGWRGWNATAPAGVLARNGCSLGTCFTYTAGGSPGQVSSPAMSIEAGQWYRLSVDLSTQQEDQPVGIALRRGGGGSNGYERLTDRDTVFVAGKQWRRYSTLMLARRTVMANDPLTGDNGARIDIVGIVKDAAVSFANMELVPVQPGEVALVSGALVNVGSTARALACPWASSQPLLCQSVRRLDDDAPLSWPVTMGPRQTLAVYSQQPGWQDADFDGVLDTQDLCPGTPPGLATNVAGCPMPPPDQR